MPETVVQNVHSYYAIKVEEIVHVIMKQEQQVSIVGESCFCCRNFRFPLQRALTFLKMFSFLILFPCFLKEFNIRKHFREQIFCCGFNIKKWEICLLFVVAGWGKNFTHICFPRIIT